MSATKSGNGIWSCPECGSFNIDWYTYCPVCGYGEGGGGYSESPADPGLPDESLASKAPVQDLREQRVISSDATVPTVRYYEVPGQGLGPDVYQDQIFPVQQFDRNKVTNSTGSSLLSDPPWWCAPCKKQFSNAGNLGRHQNHHCPSSKKLSGSEGDFTVTNTGKLHSMRQQQTAFSGLSSPPQISNQLTYDHSEDNDDATSLLSSFSVASIFSSNSVTSSATGLSAGGYSPSDIATAYKELFSILHNDAIMLPLYKTALASPAIGPERLERNLRRLFKAYSEHLKDEAADQLEYLVARLVARKSRELAESIVEKFLNGPGHSLVMIRAQYSDSSEEEGDIRPVNEEALADLATFRRFLVESQAFKTLQTQLRAFVAPKLSQRMPENDNENRNSRVPKYAAETVYAYLRNLAGLPKTTLTSVGLLETPLQPTKVRLRWSSVSVTVSPLLLQG
jgi:hypothetical protein